MDKGVSKTFVFISIAVSILIVILIIILGVSSSISRIDTGSNVNAVDIDKNYAHVKVNADYSDENIDKIKFIFTDDSGYKHTYETREGAIELSSSSYGRNYEYDISPYSLNLNDFNDIERIDVIFEYAEEDSGSSETGSSGTGASNQTNLLPNAYWRYNNVKVNKLEQFNYGNAVTLILEDSDLIANSNVEFKIYEKDFSGLAFLTTLNASSLDEFASVVWKVNQEAVINAQNWLEGNKLELYFIANGIESEVLNIIFYKQSTCYDGLMNGDEEGIDCGGSCVACSSVPNCFDGIKNGDETGIDCGGSCIACSSQPSCYNGIWDGNEEGVDCGGSCIACVPENTCYDGYKNGDETGIDCGGSCGACECTASQTRNCNIAHGTGRQTRQCVNGHYTGWSSCTLISCNSGYSRCSNVCYLSSKPCYIPYGDGYANGYCSSGTWYWGSCEVVGCDNGYIQMGNSCVLDNGGSGTECVSGQTQEENCYIQYGIGERDRTCNNGYWTSWSSCSVTDCNTGYSISGNGCVEDTPSGEPCTSSQTRSCTISHGTGQQTRQCINGYYASWGTCYVLTCNTGYIKNSAGTACVLGGSPPVTGEGLYAGTAKVDITCECPHQMGQYIAGQYCTGIHDSVEARVLVLDDGETSIAIVAIDLGFFASDKVINQAKQLYGLDHVILSSSHTHSDPRPEAGGMPALYASLYDWSRSLEYTVDWDALSNDPWYAETENKMINTIGEATANLFPATLSVGTGILNDQYMSFNRRIVSSNGCVSMCWGSCNPTEPDDQTVGVIRVHDNTGITRVMIVHYACHPVFLNEYNSLISADFPGAMSDYIEEKIPGAIGMFIQGGAGDIDPHRGSTGFTEIKNSGENLAKEALSVVTQPVSSGSIKVKNSLLQFENRKDSAYLANGFASFSNDGPHYAGLTTVVLGDSVAFVTMAGEPFVELQMSLRENSPLKPYTFLFGYSYNGQGDHFTDYLPTTEAAIQCNYCSGGSCDNYGGDYVTYLEIGAGEEMVNEGLNSIQQLLNN